MHQSRAVLALIAIMATASPALAERISNPIAVFSTLDKVTGKISTVEIPINESANFGTLTLHPRVCYSSPVTEEPKTTTFVEIDETEVNGTFRRVFTGWMFAESPALNGLEHPVYDVWLSSCKNPEADAGSNN